MSSAWALKITADGDCSHEIRRQLLLGRKALTNLDSMLKSKDITLTTKVFISSQMGFQLKLLCQLKKSFKLSRFKIAVSVQFSHSVVSDSLQPQGLQHARPPFITNSRSLLKLRSIKSVMPSNHLTLCHPLLLLPSVLSCIRVFSNESVLRIRWPKYGNFSFSISLSNEYSGFISFRIDWLDLLAVQGTLKSLPQHHSSIVPILQCSAFFMVQLSHLCMTTEKP